jgi:alpha-galactosidase
MGINTLAFRMMQHKAFFALDADCVGLTEAVPLEYNLRFMDILSKSGTPLFVSMEKSMVHGRTERLIAEAFARNAEKQYTDELEPVDWLRTTCPRKWRLNGDEVSYDWTADIGQLGFE